MPLLDCEVLFNNFNIISSNLVSTAKPNENGGESGEDVDEDADDAIIRLLLWSSQSPPLLLQTRQIPTLEFSPSSLTSVVSLFLRIPERPSKRQAVADTNKPSRSRPWPPSPQRLSPFAAADEQAVSISPLTLVASAAQPLHRSG
uniref:Uncharacterized protein n=1 Tax=Kalanchoe fedtschenkoi TaxID=63787 RepID=A0A7N1A8V5_KALFE